MARPATERFPIKPGEPILRALERAKGFYQRKMCNWPLVGYAGKGKNGRQLVGEIYANFAELEQWPHAVLHFDKQIQKIINADVVDCVCGMPMGGIVHATMLAHTLKRRLIYAEKQVVVAKTETSREQSTLVFGRHQPKKYERVVIVEDVCNNFSTTAGAIKLIEAHGAVVVGIVCFLNRSPSVRDIFDAGDGNLVHVIAVHDEAFPEFEDDDPVVAKDVAAGNIERKPKNNWARLQALMDSSGAT